MRILFATPYTSPLGGIIAWAQNIYSHYEQQEDKPCSLTLLPMDRKPFTENLASKWSRIRNGVEDYFQFIHHEREIFSKQEFDVIHLVSTGSISFFKDLIMLRIARKHNTRTVVHFHYGRIPEALERNGWEAYLLKKVMQMVDKAIVIDPKSYDYLVDTGFSNVTFIPNPLSPRSVAEAESAKQEKRISREILFAGQCWDVKGIYELIDACKQIPNIHLKMLGTIAPDMRQRLTELSGNAKWLEIVGEVKPSEVIKEMTKCDVFVLPSHTEGFPIVMLESMACGCAIVATKVGAIPSMLEETDGKRYGLLVEPRNVNQLKEALTTMLDDENLKKECRDNVQMRVRERYNITSVWKSMLDTWQSTTKNI